MVSVTRDRRKDKGDYKDIVSMVVPPPTLLRI